ncbi:phospholipid scramblase 1-like [Gigantopelta aegis]|uniref:phospholipid scramblase 1-like n=1 Tax=Gigantopelta aegis TaxID=1735272 RepID=UPI001B88A53D|nr:phospholipid scramblase 1-like [Gigantopelta aegis]
MSQPVVIQPQSQVPPGTNPQDGYGAPPGQYGVQAGQYGTPPGQYGTPPGEYGAPPGEHRAPPVVERQQCLEDQFIMQLTPGQPVQWMNRPQPIPGCPPGLEYLAQLDQLLIKQQLEILEILTGLETPNKYKIVNNMGQQVYFAAQEAVVYKCCNDVQIYRYIDITDNFGQVFSSDESTKVFSSDESTKVFSKDESTEVFSSDESTEVGKITKQRLCFFQVFFSDESTEIFSCDEGTKVGKISKELTKLIQELFTDADDFRVTFPMDLDVKMKALLLAAVFLIMLTCISICTSLSGVDIELEAGFHVL